MFLSGDVDKVFTMSTRGLIIISSFFNMFIWSFGGGLRIYGAAILQRKLAAVYGWIIDGIIEVFPLF